MPNVDAKFRADFTEFDKGVQEATGKLLDFEKQANKTGKATEDFGYKLVKAADSDKFLKGTGQMGDSLRDVDSILRMLGVNLGPLPGTISELGMAAGKYAPAIGKFAGQLGILAAVGIGVYKGVRAFGDYMGSMAANDKEVEAWALALMGVTKGQEEAAAAADVLARASATAHRPITDMREAIEINRKAAVDLARQWLQSVNPARDARNEIAEWQKQIREVNKEGNLLSLNEAIDAGNTSLEVMARRYGLTVEALEYYKRKREETFRMEDQLAQASAAANARAVAEAEKLAKAQADFAEQRFKQQLQLDEGLRASNEKLTQARLAQVNDAVLKELAAYQQLNPAIAEQDTIYTRLAAGQQQLAIAKAQGLPTLQQETLLHQQFGQALMDEAIKEEQLRWKIEDTTQARRADNQTYLDAVAAREAGKNTLSFTPLPDVGAGAGFTSREKRMQEFYGASMDPISAAYRAAGIFQGQGGAGIRPGYTINVNGNIIGTQQELARLVGDALSSNYRGGGNRTPI